MDLINTALIGFGRMGDHYLRTLLADENYAVKYICDLSPAARAAAAGFAPSGCRIVADPEEIYSDPEVDAVVLSALANSRKEQIERCIAAGKNIIAEKPLGVSFEQESALADLADETPLLTTVNLYLRNAWYHHTMRDFIDSGQIGELAIIRICHMTPGLAPGEGHEYEGPSFHDCGMHYVDIARWYARSEYSTYHAQAVRMWDYKDPWWLQCHGTFESGVVFDITQGFVYGQLSKDQTHNSYVDIIGTKGTVHMTHDFRTAHVEMRGTTRTEILDKPYGGKNIDVLCSRFASSLRTGVRDPQLPRFRDAQIASKFAWKFLGDAASHTMPSIGDNATLEQIRERRRNMTDGYGLLHKRGDT